MKRFKLIISIVFLIVSLLIIFDKLFAPQPIQIILESGQEVTAQTPNYYSMSEVLLLIVSSFLVGALTLYIFYNSEQITSAILGQKERKEIRPEGHHDTEKYRLVIPLLKTDEKTIFSALRDSNGDMLQNNIVKKTGMGKVAVTRALSKLEMKNLVVRERQGLTNRVRLK
ncbi:MAG: hypothetical protein NT001_04120 [Candidatus Woesearchaeota archaeon]|nr:hypothetical protein [Candidatus Woesearchaeota archaeon]